MQSCASSNFSRRTTNSSFTETEIYASFYKAKIYIVAAKSLKFSPSVVCRTKKSTIARTQNFKINTWFRDGSSPFSLIQSGFTMHEQQDA